jgi:hypothetical protein
MTTHMATSHIQCAPHTRWNMCAAPTGCVTSIREGS